MPIDPRHDLLDRRCSGADRRWQDAASRTGPPAKRSTAQAPFRAGIHLDAYQLVPLAKALALPRVNLLIADDVGAGKTIEAGLILRELILRRRVDFIMVCAPPSMTRQWQDELQAKFGLAFTIIDREYLAAVRRERGFAVNPWSSGSLFLLSHSLVTDEVYTSGLRDVLGEFRARSLLILDEAHHAAPASGSRYAVDSQFTRAIEALAPCFEHRLFLTATPHNGHSNSFTKLLEILDPQRFTAGVDVKPDDLAPVMVRRLKSDLKHFGENFPTRRVEAIVIDNLPADAPELVLPISSPLTTRSSPSGRATCLQPRWRVRGLSWSGCSNGYCRRSRHSLTRSKSIATGFHLVVARALKTRNPSVQD